MTIAEEQRGTCSRCGKLIMRYGADGIWFTTALGGSYDCGGGLHQPTVTYQDEVDAIRVGFEYELCESCGRDLDQHIISPDPLGHAHAWCLRESD